MSKAILFCIHIYRQTLSKLLPSRCRFYPSCSHYMEQAIRRFGLFRGVSLGLGRLCRCHPFNAGGYDAPY